MSERIIVGDPVTLENTFTVSGVGTDPDTVTVTVTEPDGTTATPSVSAAAGTGYYTATFTTSQDGLHQVEWVGAGTVDDTADDTFRVFASADPTLYAGLDEVKAALRITGTTDDDTLTSALAAACRTIDDWCGRFFYRTAAGQVRYATSGGAVVTIPDAVAVTTVDIDDGTGAFATEWAEGTNFALTPRAAALDDAPYTQLSPLNAWRFPEGRERIRVTGTFGWPAVPPAVSQAAVMQASRIWKRTREAPFGIATLPLDGGGMRLLARIDSEVEVLLRPYQRPLVY